MHNNMNKEQITINVDFDGTCVSHEFPLVGNDIGAVEVLKKLVLSGHKLILFTMRSDRLKPMETKDSTIKNVTGTFLTDAVKWFEENGIPLHGIQKNPTQHNWTTSPKSYAQLMIDDSALGCPLKFDNNISNKTFVDWKKVDSMLIEMGLYKVWEQE